MRNMLILLAGLAAPDTAVAASFDCTRADLAPDEKVICDTRDLNDADVRMATTFDLLAGLFAMGRRGAMQDDQMAWLQQRQACGADAACLGEAYDRRLGELQAIYDTIDRPL